MEIYVLRNGVPNGPYERDLLVSKVRVGEFYRNDLSWHAGLDAWHPLERLLGLPPLIVPPVPQRPPVPAPHARPVAHQATAKDDYSLFYGMMILGLVLLVVSGAVIVFSGGFKDTPAQAAQDDAAMTRSQNYDFAQGVAEKMLISPSSASWTSPTWSPDKAGAEEVGHGFWHAWGEVDAANAFNVKIHESWEVYFFPAKQMVLYARVGTNEVGSREAAMAGVKEAGAQASN